MCHRKIQHRPVVMPYTDPDGTRWQPPDLHIGHHQPAHPPTPGAHTVISHSMGQESHIAWGKNPTYHRTRRLTLPWRHIYMPQVDIHAINKYLSPTPIDKQKQAKTRARKQPAIPDPPHPPSRNLLRAPSRYVRFSPRDAPPLLKTKIIKDNPPNSDRERQKKNGSMIHQTPRSSHVLCHSPCFTS